MSQYQRTRLLLCSLLDILRETFSDAADAHSLTRHRFAQNMDRFAFRVGALGDHNDREVSARPTTRDDLLAHFIYVVRNFGNQDYVSGSREPGVQSDESGVTTHHLEHDHPIVALGRCVEFVDCLERGIDRSIEAEGGNRAADIVVDGLRHAHYPHSPLAELVCDRQRSVTTDRDHRINSKL